MHHASVDGVGCAHRFFSAVNAESDAGSVPEMKLRPKSLRRANADAREHEMRTHSHSHARAHAIKLTHPTRSHARAQRTRSH